MNYIIDGHNLVPKIPGLKLSDPEDEKALIDLLIPFLRMTRSRAKVFFDHGAEGQSGDRNFGLVKATFMPFSAIGANPANAGAVRLCGGLPCPAPDTATALPNHPRYQLR